jgi:hypothetical protein
MLHLQVGIGPGLRKDKVDRQDLLDAWARTVLLLDPLGHATAIAVDGGGGEYLALALFMQHARGALLRAGWVRAVTADAGRIGWKELPVSTSSLEGRQCAAVKAGQARNGT